MQLRIEAQGKYLQAVLEKAQDTLGRQNLGTTGLEAAKVQLSELVSKVSTKCLNSALSGMKDVSGFCPQQKQTNQPIDFSLDGCLTSCGGFQRDQELHNNRMGLIPLASKIDNDTLLQQTELRWCKDLKESRKKELDVKLHASDLSMSVGVQGEKLNGNRSYTEEEFRKRDTDVNFLNQNTKRTDSVKPENEEIAQGFQLSCFAPNLDLNIHENNDPASRRKQFDLKGFN